MTLYWASGEVPPATGGNFELSGLDPQADYPVYFLDPQRRLGARQTLRADSKEITVVLKPCGEASVRFVDAQGQPQAGVDPFLFFVMTPGVSQFDHAAGNQGKMAAECDFIANIDPANYRPPAKSDAQGRIRFPVLIPGATYQLDVLRNGRVTKDFSVTPGQQLDLGTIEIAGHTK